MDYRDEREALRARVENLEQDLAEAKRELKAQRRKRTRGEKAPDAPDGGPPSGAPSPERTFSARENASVAIFLLGAVAGPLMVAPRVR